MRNEILETIATDLIGDGNTPNLFFVSYDAIISAVFVSAEHAQEYAESLGEYGSVLVEDRITGEVWRNHFYNSEEGL